MGKPSAIILMTATCLLAAGSCGPPAECRSTKSCGPAIVVGVPAHWESPPAAIAGTEAVVEVVPLERSTSTLATVENEWTGIGGLGWTASCVRRERGSLVRFQVRRVLSGEFDPETFYALQGVGCFRLDFSLPPGRESIILVVRRDGILSDHTEQSGWRHMPGSQYMEDWTSPADDGPVLTVRLPPPFGTELEDMDD